MLYLSRLIPDLRAAAVRRDLANPYEMHRTLMRALPDHNDGGPGRILWRVDSNPHTGGLHLLVQSTLPPDWSQLDLGWLVTPPQQRKFAPVFRPGQRLRFRLRANPTRRAGKAHPDPAFVGKRVPIMDLDGQLVWFVRKARCGGFHPIGRNGDGDAATFDVAVSHAGIARSYKLGPDRSKMIAIDHYAVVFDGVLMVNDPEVFRHEVIRGIGPAKAFGFGLLSVAPVR